MPAGSQRWKEYKIWFSGRGWGQRLFSFQSPAVHWMARPLHCIVFPIENPYQTPHSLNCLPFSSLKNAWSHTPSQKSAPGVCVLVWNWQWDELNMRRWTNLDSWTRLKFSREPFRSIFRTQFRFGFFWEKLNRVVSKPGGFPLFSGKVQIVSRTLSGLFLVGALNRPRKRKGTNRGNPRRVPEQIGKIPEQIGKVPKRTEKDRKGPKKEEKRRKKEERKRKEREKKEKKIPKKGQKRTKKEGQVQIGKPPRLKHPRLAALEFNSKLFGAISFCRGATLTISPGRAHHEVQTVNWKTWIFEAESAQLTVCTSRFSREGVNREKQTVKRLSITRCFFHRFCPLSTVKSSA